MPCNVTIGPFRVQIVRRMLAATGGAILRHSASVATLVTAPIVAGMSMVEAPEVRAASGVRIVGGTWNPPGSDNYPPALNAQSVKTTNTCSKAQVLTGWRLHDNKAKHTFRFPSGFRIGPGASVTVYSGRGTRTATKLFFGRTYGAVWNDAAPEKAYLKNAAGTTVSTWSAY